MIGPTSSDHVSRWLTYAWDVLNADEQTAVDAAHGGGCVDDPTAPDLRWPGYLGEDFDRRRILLVGNVHTSFASNGVPAWVADDLVARTKAWRAQPSAQDEYLNGMRRAYLAGFTGSPRWTIATPFTAILDAIDSAWSEVAYTNGSKSQLRSGRTSGLVEAGIARFPVSSLAKDVLEAQLVITCSAPVRDHLLAAGVPVAYWRQNRWSHADVARAADEARALLVKQSRRG